MTLSSNKSAGAGAAGRFIPSEELTDDQVQQWNFGSMDGGFVPMGMQNPPPPPPPPPHIHAAAHAGMDDGDAHDNLGSDEDNASSGISEEQLNAMLAEAREQAHAEAIAQAQAQLDQIVAEHDAAWQQKLDEQAAALGAGPAAQLAAVVEDAQAQVRQLQQQLAPQLLQLAIDIARQVVRQELRSNPRALLPIVREALDMLGAETKPAVVRVHPDDWAHLQQHLKAAVPNPKVEWLTDASVAAGGCRVEAAGAVVDGSIERRWQRAVAALGLASTWFESPSADKATGGETAGTSAEAAAL